MTSQEYIQTKLNDLKEPLGLSMPTENKELADMIYRFVASKKFRKYSLSPEQENHIKSAIKLNIEHKKPIQLTLVFGGYKLWRLEETPRADWAELFALMYYTSWMKPICEIYETGVWFDFFSDDVIVPKMNNVPSEDTKAYLESFKELLKFINPHQPKNLKMTLNRVGDQYTSSEEFEQDLEEQIKELERKLDGGLPELNDTARATLDLNVHTTTDQVADPKWHEKIQLIHDAYAQVRGRRPYYLTPDKFNVMTTHIPGMLSVGTTKDSVMKFWVGAGVLLPRGASYRQLILSSNQLGRSTYKFENLDIGLDDRNFKQIRILE